MTYSMNCTCGTVMSVEAENRDEAVGKLKDMMTAEAVTSHFAEKHQGQPVLSKEQSDSMIEQMVKEG